MMVVLLMLFLAGPVQDSQTVDLGHGLKLAYRFEQDPQLNRPVRLHLRVVGGSVTDVIVDGRMPAHRHGLIHAPKLIRKSEREWVVEDLLLHMPGRWVISIDIGDHGDYRRVDIPIQLRPS